MDFDEMEVHDLIHRSETEPPGAACQLVHNQSSWQLVTDASVRHCRGNCFRRAVPVTDHSLDRFRERDGGEV
jgi:hypothetical protein